LRQELSLSAYHPLLRVADHAFHGSGNLSMPCTGYHPSKRFLVMGFQNVLFIFYQKQKAAS